MEGIHRRVWLGFASLLSLNTLFMILAWLAPNNPWFWPTIGLGGNPNYVGCALTVCLAASIVYNFRWFIPIAVIGLILSESRNAIIISSLLGIVLLWRYSKLGVVLIALLATVLVLWQKIDGAAAVGNRLGIWQDAVNHMTFFGHGFASFANEYANWPLRRAEALTLAPHAYNDFLEMVFDLGVGAALFWLAVIAAFERAQAPELIIGLVYVGLGLVFFPLWVPIVGHLFYFTLGRMTNTERKLAMWSASHVRT